MRCGQGYCFVEYGLVHLFPSFDGVAYVANAIECSKQIACAEFVSQLFEYLDGEGEILVDEVFRLRGKKDSKALDGLVDGLMVGSINIESGEHNIAYFHRLLNCFIVE